MSGAHGNSSDHRVMAQNPDTCKELAFFRRVLVKQEKELGDFSKRADPRDRSRETLEARMRTRKTRRAIENIILQMGKRAMENQDSDGGESSSGSGARPPEHPPPPLPPLPPEPPRGTGIGASGTQTATPPAVRSLQPTEVPDFDPSRPRWYAGNASGSQRRSIIRR